MRKFNLIQTLEYCDIPQLFIANDAVNNLYLCLYYDYLEGNFCYNCVLVSKHQLDLFLKNYIDLRHVFTEPELDNCYYLMKTTDYTSLEASLMAPEEITEEMLPEEGYYFEEEFDQNNQDLLNKANVYFSPVISLALEDEQDSNEIDTECLSSLIVDFQRLVTNCHCKKNKKNKKSDSILKVCATPAASFDIIFRGNCNLDLYGESPLNETLQSIKELFTYNDQEQHYKLLRELKGHTVNSYTNLLKTLNNNKLSLRYSFSVSTINKQVESQYLSYDSVKSICSLLDAHVDLEDEIVKYTGTFSASSIVNGKWKMKAKDEDTGDYKIINGDTTDKSLLSGIVIDTQEYTIECKETQTQDNLNNTILSHLILQKIL